MPGRWARKVSARRAPSGPALPRGRAVMVARTHTGPSAGAGGRATREGAARFLGDPGRTVPAWVGPCGPVHGTSLGAGASELGRPFDDQHLASQARAPFGLSPWGSSATYPMITSVRGSLSSGRHECLLLRLWLCLRRWRVFRWDRIGVRACWRAPWPVGGRGVGSCRVARGPGPLRST